MLVWLWLLAGSAFVLVLGGYLTIANLQARIGLQVFAIVTLAAWTAVAIVKPWWRVTTPLFLPVIVASGAYLASAVLSQRPRLSLEPVMGGLGFALAFLFLTRLLANPYFRQRVGTLLVTTVAFVSLVYIGQVLFQWMTWWQLIGYVSIPPLRPNWAGLTFGTPNLVAGYLLLAGPLAIAVAKKRAAKRSALWAGVLAIGILLAILLTGGRSAFASVVVGALAFVLVQTPTVRGAWTIRNMVRTVVDRPVFVVLAAAGALGVALLLPAVVYRFEQGGDAVRVDLWRSALELFVSAPVLGTGPGTWSLLKVDTSPEGTPNLIFSNAHNLYFQAAAEIGLVGVVASMGLVVVMLRRFLGAHRTVDRVLRLEFAAGLAGIVAIAAQAVFDSLVNMPMVCLLIVGIVAWLESAVPEGVNPSATRLGEAISRAQRSRVTAVCGLVGVLLTVPALARIDGAWALYSRGNESAEIAAYVDALYWYEAARDLDPEFTLYSLQVASMLAHSGHPESAMEIMTVAIAEDSTPINQIGLAALELEVGLSDRALKRARDAYGRSFNDSTIALNAGRIGEAVGDLEFALTAFADAVAWNPPLARSGFWLDPARQVPFDRVIELALDRTMAAEGGLILAYAGRSEAAFQALDRAPGSHTRDLYVAAATWLAGDYLSARAQLEAMLESNPLDWMAAAWLSRMARISGDLEAGEKYERWALMVQWDTALSVVLERSAIPPINDAPLAGLPRAYPSAPYARPASPYLPMPYLTTIGVR